MKRGTSLLVLLLSAASARAEIVPGIAFRENLLYLAAPRLTAPGLPNKAYWLSATFVRPTLEATYAEWNVDAALELATLANSAGVRDIGRAQAGGSAFARGDILEWWELTAEPVREPDKNVRLRAERLKVSRSFGAFDVDLGRQPVSLGTSHFVGVLDVLAPFPPGDLDATYKPGIDAARIRTSIGEEGEIEGIGAGAYRARDAAGILRLRHPVRSVDVELVGGRFRGHHFGGAGWEGDIEPFAVWGEAALFDHPGSPKFSGVGGADYKLAENTTLGLGYLYQAFGARRASELAAVALDAPYREGWAFLGGRQYAVLAAHAEPHPLIHINLSGIVSLTDGSTLWQPRLTWNAADEADVSFYGWIATGRAPEGLILRSEFGSMADGAGMYCRVFF
ncbi:MAG: hypothetical protein ABIJ96_09870 [Elusimicrobiota bacterium]